MEITTLADSVDTPPASRVSAESTSLVIKRNLALATRTIPQSDTAYPTDDFVWSASAGDDGSCIFYAVPQKNLGNSGASSQWNSSSSTQVFTSDWHTQNAVFQYALHASMPAPMTGQLINLFA